MVELSVEHVLLFVVIVFLLYHLMGSSRCVNRFRVGGERPAWRSAASAPPSCTPPCRSGEDPTSPNGPIIDEGEYLDYPNGPYCNYSNDYGGTQITQNLDIANCQLSDPRCFWDFSYRFNGSGKQGKPLETKYGACRSFCNASTVIYDEDKPLLGCKSINGSDIAAETKCSNTKVSGLPEKEGYLPNEFYNCIWDWDGWDYQCTNPHPPRAGGFFPCESDMSKFEPRRICAIDKWAPERFYRSHDRTQTYCDCPSGYDLEQDIPKDLYRCIKSE